MRRTTLAVRHAISLAALVALAAPLAACNGFFKHGTLIEEPPAHREPTTTSIYGDWVLATPSDSTAFAGASLVELNVAQSSFTITASYPQSAPTVVRGTLATTDGALLTLTPTSGTRSGRGPLALVAGQPVTVLASAAGNTMVFSPPGGVTASDPSSVWHRKAAAKAAGDLPAKTP